MLRQPITEHDDNKSLDEHVMIAEKKQGFEFPKVQGINIKKKRGSGYSKDVVTKEVISSGWSIWTF